MMEAVPADRPGHTNISAVLEEKDICLLSFLFLDLIVYKAPRSRPRSDKSNNGTNRAPVGQLVIKYLIVTNSF